MDDIMPALNPGLQEYPFANFVGGSDRYSKDLNINQAWTKNFYADKIPTGNSRVSGGMMLRPCHGYQEITKYDFASPIRKIFALHRGFGQDLEPTLLVVAGSAVYHWNTNKAQEPTKIAEIETTENRVEVTDGGTQVFIADGLNGYVISYNDSTLTKLVAGTNDFPCRPRVCATVSHYTIISGIDVDEGGQPSNNWWFSAPYNATDWNDSQGGRNYAPDAFYSPIKNMVGMAGLLWLFGDDAYECWKATGDNDMPFARIEGSYQGGAGLMSERSLIDNGGVVAWLGHGQKGRAVFYITGVDYGYRPNRISIESVEEMIEEFPDLASVRGFRYSEHGHDFFHWYFPESGLTLCYDLSTKQWIQRSSLTEQNLDGPWKIVDTVTVGSDIFARTENATKISKIGEPEWLDNGAVVSRSRTAPAILTDMKRAIHHSLTIDAQCGYGNYTDPVTVMLDISDDGGLTWQSPRRYLEVALGGQYDKIVQFRSLGQARRRVYRVSMTDPVGLTLLDAFLTMRVSTART
jgi:hypothetical protein